MRGAMLGDSVPSGTSRTKRQRSLARASGLGITFALLLTMTIGCGSSNPQPSSNIHSGSHFSPVKPFLSPNTVWHQPVSLAAPARTGMGVVGAGNASTPALDHYFFLVNGVMSDGAPLPTGQNAPAPSATPMVLTVNGVAPEGATNPNGGTAVGLTVLGAGVGTGAQLWKAVQGPQAGTFYLRSAESFTVSQTNPGTFSMLGGYGVQPVAPLELGYIPGWGAALSWNQQGSPTGDMSAFQQWIYDSTTAQLTNQQGSGQLYASSSTVDVAAQAPAPANQWYAYPNYFLEQVVNQPNSSPPFPAPTTDSVAGTDAAGEQAAYDYLSSQILGAAVNPSCNYEGTTYTGIRCEYSNLNALSTLTECAALTSSLNPPKKPTSYNGVAISSADWTAVYQQIHNECQYAASVQTMFSNFNDILNFVFIENSDAILPLAIDVGVSANQSLNVVPIEIIEGIVYTALSAVGSVAGGGGGAAVGAFANLIETATDSALAAQPAIGQQMATTVGNLYTDLGQQFQVLQQQANNGENAILQDWGRLSAIGPLTEINGYNGLGLTSADITAIEAQAIQGYKVAVMQLLMPLEYSLWASFANAGPPTGLDTSTYNTYSYSTFGSNTANNNTASFSTDGVRSNTPSLQVMQTDIFDNGANPFEVFNGLNGWAALTVNFDSGENCSIAAITLFNATANDFTVGLIPSEGTIAYPGCSQVSCESSYDSFELRPYGYLTMYAGANTSKEHLQTTANIYLAGAQVGSLSVEGQNFCYDSATISATATASAGSGFSFTDVGTKVSTQFGDGGVWTTIYQ